MALWPLLPLEMVPQGSLFSSWRYACPSRLLGQQTKLLSFSPRVFVLIPLLHVMKFLVSSRTFFQIASLTVGTLSCSACKLCSHPCWHLWTVTWSLDTGKGRSNHLQTFLPDFGVSYTGCSNIISCLENFSSPLTGLHPDYPPHLSQSDLVKYSSDLPAPF